jgi:saccharopine dehydrogenase-like NADP-dependent oxidoreductase
MKVLCLGGAGRISRESAFDLVQFCDFEKMTIADCDIKQGQEVVSWLNDSRVGFRHVDLVNDPDGTVELISQYDIVMDGTAISLNDKSTACIAKAGVDGINLNGCGTEWAFDKEFGDKGRRLVAGMGMTPGITNMMTLHAAGQLDTAETIRISHGAFRSIAFSPSITETTRIEYDPDLPDRVVYENGEFVQVPPFARPREIKLPEPFGTHTQWIIPHAETRTLPKSLSGKGIKLIEVRGTWPPKKMQLIRALYDWGILSNPMVNVNGGQVGLMDAVGSYLINSDVGSQTDLWGYALHVEVLGQKGDGKFRHVLTHTHPPSDGSVTGWEKLRAYTRNVGIPMSIGAQLMAKGKVNRTGVLAPEEAFDPTEVFAELEKRQIFIHEKIKAISESESQADHLSG